MKFQKFKTWLISKIANGDPVLMNWNVHTEHLPSDVCLAYIPSENSHMSSSSSLKAILTPANGEKLKPLTVTYINAGAVIGEV